LKLLAITIGSFLAVCASACIAEPKPLLVVIERDPWAMVMGSDSPRLALYDDGTLICASEKPSMEQPFVSRKIANTAKFGKEIAPFDLTKLGKSYLLSNATDQITTIIWTPAKSIGIYGNWRRSRSSDRETSPILRGIGEREKKMKEYLPQEIRSILEHVDEQIKVGGAPWLPEKIEVMFWPYEYAPDESIIWPKEWPDLYAKETRQRRENSFSVYLTSVKFGDLLRFFRTRKEKGAVLINGKKMADYVRFPFPGEGAWME